MKDSSISCSVRISNTIDESVSISDSNGKTYHQAYGVVYSDSNSYSDDINTILELSTSSTDSKSISFSESGTFSNSSERILTYTEGKVTSVTDSDENTHSDTHESSYAYIESEEHSYARTDGGEIVDETNWSKSEETTHRAKSQAEKLSDSQKILLSKRGGGSCLQKLSDSQKILLSKRGGGSCIQKLSDSQKILLSKRGGGSCLPCEVVDTITNVGGTLANSYFQYEANNIAEDANDIAKNSTEAAYIANDIARNENTIAEKANNITLDANAVSWKANNLTLQSITSQETIAEKDRELQIQLNKLNSEQELSISLAGTRMTSDSYTTITSNGGSHSQSSNWSTDSSGISNSWTTSNGYSDSYTKGHLETSTEESTQSDSISFLLSNSFTKDNGWSFESSSSNSASNSYSFDKSNTISHTNDISMDKSIDRSIEKSYQRSLSYANTKEQSQTIEFHIPDNGCYNLTAVPLFKSETLLECNKKQTESVVIDNNYQNKNYISDNGKPKNTLISGEYLYKGNKFKSTNGKYYFGLLEETSELALCKGEFNKKNIVWSNGIDYLKDDKYNLKFWVNYNGHLVVTAQNIFA
eukprot:jgi/Orpsp1_1/1179820/evm.model.c7180000070882.1